MMPDLGQYAGAVLAAYAISLGLLIGIVVVSVIRYRRMKADLERVEQGRNG